MKIHPFMVRSGEQKYVTESYVSIPPALIITDEAGNIWTLGFKMGPVSGGEFTFNVLCNGFDTGKFANRIERRRDQIRIFGPNGWENMQVTKQESIRVYAIGAKVKKINDKMVPITVKIYFDSRPDLPVISFIFNPLVGGMEDLIYNPVICASGQWLYAIVEPEDVDVVVAGYLGERNIREIPIRKGVKHE